MVLDVTVANDDGKYCCSPPASTQPVKCFEVFVKSPVSKAMSGIAIALIIVAVLLVLAAAVVLIGKKLQSIRKRRYAGLLHEPVSNLALDFTVPVIVFLFTKLLWS